jgi:hypothetical protein
MYPLNRNVDIELVAVVIKSCSENTFAGVAMSDSHSANPTVFAKLTVKYEGPQQQ